MKTQYILYLALFSITVVTAQEKTEKKVLKKAEKEMAKSTRLSEKYTYEAVQGLEKGNPTQAEADFRKAISEDSTNIKATYNLGNTYYQQKAYDEAFLRYKQAGINNKANSSEKHKTYHNLGNVFMKAKTYDKAVEAYKEALRNNPTDEETRYNLAVAQEMLKKIRHRMITKTIKTVATTKTKIKTTRIIKIKTKITKIRAIKTKTIKEIIKKIKAKTIKEMISRIKMRVMTSKILKMKIKTNKGKEMKTIKMVKNNLHHCRQNKWSVF